jgi:hypothetical protein
MAMTTADLRTEIMQMIKEEEDASILEAIRTLLQKVRYAAAEEDDDLTDQEVAELEERRYKRRSGQVEFLSEEEFQKTLREKPIE